MELTEYIRNILFFIIFAAFIQIIIPDIKYKKYIDTVTGLALICIVARPAMAYLGGGQIPVHRIFAGMDAYASPSMDIMDYEGLQNDMVKKTYDELAVKQMQSLLDKEGRYRILSARIEASEDFGQILQVSLHLQEIETGTGRGLIWIEPVQIGTGRGKAATEEPPEIKNIKNTISHFYNLSPDNIHITVQKKNRTGDEQK